MFGIEKVDIRMANTCDTHYVEIKSSEEFKMVLKTMFEDADRICYPAKRSERNKITFILMDVLKNNKKEFKDYITCKYRYGLHDKCSKTGKKCPLFVELNK